jgi:hypothetical protein
VSFAKVAEYQKRGAVHFHAVIRLDGPDGGDTPPPAWATAELLTDAIRAAGVLDRRIRLIAELAQLDITEHARRLIRTAWALGACKDLEHLMTTTVLERKCYTTGRPLVPEPRRQAGHGTG